MRETCIDSASQRRVLFFNAIPDHEISIPRGRSSPCAAAYKLTLPRPEYKSRTIEIPAAGPIAFARNGVPIYSPVWAAHNSFLFEERAWAGHPYSQVPLWHYHFVGPQHPFWRNNETHFVAYALDGFPIFGPTAAALDACNGRFVRGQYQYHVVQSPAEVDLRRPYCAAGNAVNWNFVLGCYHGSTSSTRLERDTGSRIGLQCTADADYDVPRPAGM